MEIKIGITDVPREVTIESEESPQDVASKLRESLSQPDGVFTLSDPKGRTILVPTRTIAYVDLGQPNARPVGFGTV